MDGQPDSPADTASFPSYLNGFVARQRPGGQRWLDGYRRVLSTAAQGKLFSPDRRAGRRAARGAEGAVSVSRGSSHGCVSVYTHSWAASKHANSDLLLLIVGSFRVTLNAFLFWFSFLSLRWCFLVQTRGRKGSPHSSGAGKSAPPLS